MEIEYEIKTMKQLDNFINYLTDRKILYMAADSQPSMTPEIKRIYDMFYQVRQAESAEQALDLYRSILDLAPNFVAARYNMANLMRKNGILEEALDQYILAAQYNPKDPSIFIEIGTVLVGLGNKEKAIESYLYVLEITSENDLSGKSLSTRWLAMLNIGVNYRELRKYGESLEWLKKALSWVNRYSKSAFSNAWDSEFVAAYLEIGSLYREMNKIEECEEMYLLGAGIAEKSNSLDPDLRTDETYIWHYLGIIYLDRGKWEDAEFYFKKALARNPYEAEFLNALEKARKENA